MGRRATSNSSGSLKEHVYSSLKNDIVSGVLGVGEKLLESQLAERYKVSKTPVREALSILEREGLVEVIPRVGYFTSRITVKDIQDVFELRFIVEGASAALAAMKITPAEIDVLESLHNGYIPGDNESYRQFLEENTQFHYRVALASGNDRLADSVKVLLEQMQRLLVLRLELRDGADEMLGEHERIVAALRARDTATARREMEVSIDNAREAVLQSILRQPKGWSL
jgi:GntR family transcriptional regulator, rspAB operon transcriptional repressor